MTMITIYKIRNKDNGYYSHGRFTKNHWLPDYTVKWSGKGKEWASEKAVKEHLMLAIKYNGSIPANWEIIEFTQQPSRELNDWITDKMLVKMLEANHL